MSPTTPARGDIFTTDEQLSLLPEKSVVLDKRDVAWQKVTRSGALSWVSAIGVLPPGGVTTFGPFTAVHVHQEPAFKPPAAPAVSDGWVPTDEEVVAAFKRGADSHRDGEHQYQHDLEAAALRWITRQRQTGTVLSLPDREELAKVICESRWKVTAPEWRWDRISQAQRTSWLETADVVLRFLSQSPAVAPDRAPASKEGVR